MDCNDYMDAVDIFLRICYTEYIRRTVKWYKKVFSHTVDLSLLNPHAIYQTLSGRKFCFGEFQHQIIK